VDDRRVPERVEGIEAVESSLDLPGPEGELDAALADADAGLGAEEGSPGLQSFPASRLMCPPKLRSKIGKQFPCGEDPRSSCGARGLGNPSSPEASVILGEALRLIERENLTL
jgi:hypothetical protein